MAPTGPNIIIFRRRFRRFNADGLKDGDTGGSLLAVLSDHPFRRSSDRPTHVSKSLSIAQ